MYIVIIGADAEGLSLARISVRAGHDVVVIEPRKAIAQAAAEKIDARVLNASITDVGIAEEAGLADADVLVATTGDDAANLMSVFLAREAGVDRLVSVVNTEEHEALFTHLDVETLVDPERIVAEHLYSRIRGSKFVDALPLPDGAQAYYFELSDSSPLVDCTVVEAIDNDTLPDRCVVVAIRRGEELIIPAGDTSMTAGDRVSLVSGETLSDSDIEGLRGQ